MCAMTIVNRIGLMLVLWLLGAPLVPADDAKPAAEDANAVLHRAREARAAWEDFPGLSADVTVRIDDVSRTGRFSIDRLGKVILKLDEPALLGWAETQINQLVEHRLPAGELGAEARFADSPGEHPLGRLIVLDEPRMGSRYRVRDDVIYEVSRTIGPQRFTISVLEVERNAEQKYLPRVYTVSFWSVPRPTSAEKEPAAELLSTHTTRIEWQRIGRFDVPVSLTEITATSKGPSVRKLEFSGYALHAAERE
jgi:hypothetical protein